jgi:murein DD-endopeptidase MepM/ murein hydrolase activator NlpD
MMESNMKRFGQGRRWVGAVAAICAFTVSAQAQTPGAAGRWEGRIGGSGLRLVLDITRARDGLYLGKLTSPDQGGVGTPFDRLEVSNDTVRFAIQSLRITFSGLLNADATRLAGTWTQGASARLEFARDTRVVPPSVPANAPVPPSPLGVQAVLSIAQRPMPFRAEGKQHLVYEIHIDNYGGVPLLISRLDVFGEADSAGGQRVGGRPAAIAQWEGASLHRIIAQYRTEATDNREIPAAGWAVAYVWVELDSAARAPAKLRNRITVGQQTVETSVAVAAERPIVIGPPLRGSDWVAMNGPDNVGGHHRRALLTTGGEPFIAQRFAIDWAKVGANGRMFDGDQADNMAYAGYGADVLAVADGVIASVRDGIPDNVPGLTSRAVPITMETVAGNSVILDLGNGRFAFYAHLVPGSLRVKAGDRVRRGDVIGLLGNSGNSTAPHLHFHVSDRNAGLAAEGLPYAIDSWELRRGTSVWERRTNELPVLSMRVRFP